MSTETGEPRRERDPLHDAETLEPPPGAAPSAETDPEGLLGTRIGGYLIRRFIAGGGMGYVYEAEQARPRRTVALKIMRRGLNVARFQYESETLGRLQHPGIAQIYQAGVHGAGDDARPWFAMEYVPNALPITEYVRRWKLTLDDRLELFGRVIEAVDHAHRKGITHRDLKPSNLLIDSAGQPKVIDFGVARAVDADRLVPESVGQIVGTILYMSPEQIDADPHDLDPATDVYALGVVLYEIVTGRLPYDLTEAFAEAARAIREHPPRPVRTWCSEASGTLEAVIGKALEKRRQHRYRSAGALLDALAEEGTTSGATATTPRQHRRVMWLAFAVVGAALTALASGILLPDRSPSAATPQEGEETTDPTKESVEPIVQSPLDATVASPRAGGPGGSSWTPPAEVEVTGEWANAGQPFEVLPRPRQPGPDDFLTLAVRADRTGWLYVLVHRAGVGTEVSVVISGGDDCPVTEYRVPDRLVRLETYRADALPGIYTLLVVLTDTPHETLCATLPNALRDIDDVARDAGDVIGALVEGGVGNEVIIGYASYVYTVLDSNGT